LALAGLLSCAIDGTAVAQPNSVPMKSAAATPDSPAAPTPPAASVVGGVAVPETFEQIAPLFRQHCGACHGAEKAEGELRLDRLNPDLAAGPDRDRWREVFDRLNLGDMPPEKAPTLPETDRERLTNWLLREMKRAELARNPATHFRRLTRLEYERTMQDLLGLPLEFASRLPEDGRAKSGFRNDGEMLRMSPLQFELFFQIAEEALASVIVEGPPPAAHRYRLAPAEKQGSIETTVLPRPDGQPSESFAYFAKPERQSPAFRIWNMSPVNRDKKKEAAAKEAAAKEAAGKPAGAKEAAPLDIDPDRMLPPAAIQRYSEAAVKLPQHCFAVGFHQAFRSGEALIRVRAARVAEADGGGDPARPPQLTLAIGSTNFHGVELKTVGQPVVVDHDDFRVHEFRVRMENMPAPNTSPPADRNATVIAAWNSARPTKDDSRPPRLRIEWIELETPFLEQWPPSPHRAIMSVEAGVGEEAAQARQVIERFATRAFRRPLAPAELDRLLALWQVSRQDASSFESSLRETLAVVLASPQFLALPAARGVGLPGTQSLTPPASTVERQPASPEPAAPVSVTPNSVVPNSLVPNLVVPERVDDYQLATRLSYFLWSTMPDERLMALARSGRLQAPATLAEETRRMLADPRSWSFIEQFTEQWLELDRLQRVAIQRDRYPGFDDDLAAAMRLETLHFVAALMRENRSLFQLIDSQETFVNETLAGHYGIAGVRGPEFRRVALAPESHRGGVLAHAGILAGTSDGVEGHPIKRGMWLLKNLLDETPPPPPPNVPELETKNPKNRGMTVPQLLAAHRESKACAGCHRRIDPWGLAFEEYDAVGNWQREGVGAELRRRRTNQPVDAVADLPTGVKVNGLRELQAELLRSKADALRRAAARKLMTYALGRTLTLTDIEAADKLAVAVRERGDGLGTLVELVTQSEAFQTR
jgi:mono/diheme cytochrome c family protein